MWDGGVGVLAGEFDREGRRVCLLPWGFFQVESY